MAAAIPAAIGAGASIFSSLRGGKGVDKQTKLAQQQMEMARPFLQAQSDMTQMSLDAVSRNLNPLLASLNQGTADADALGGSLIDQFDPVWAEALAQNNQLFGQGQGLIGTGQQLFNNSLGYLNAAGKGLSEVQNFYRPFMNGANRAIDNLLPSAQRTWENIAPEVGNINQGFQSASDNIAKYAPRGARTSTLMQADMNRQKQINDQFFQARNLFQDKALQAAFKGAEGQGQTSNALANLFQTGSGMGLNTIGAGLNTIGTGANQLSTKGGLAQNMLNLGLSAKQLGLANKQASGNILTSLMGVPNQGANVLSSLYEGAANRAQQTSLANANRSSGLGGYLVDLFKDKGIQNTIDGWLRGIFGKGGGSDDTAGDRGSF